MAATIVRGRVIYSRIEPHPQYHNLNTVVVVIGVDEVLKGAAGPSFSFSQFIWDPRDRIDHAGYVSGKEILLFLNPVTGAGLTSPVGLSQGRFEVIRSPQGEPTLVNGVGNRGLFQGMETMATTSGISSATRRILAARGAASLPVELGVLREVVGKPMALASKEP